MAANPPERTDHGRQGQQYLPPRQWSTTQPDTGYPPGQYPPPSQWSIGQPDQHPAHPYPQPPQYSYPASSYPPTSYPPTSYPPASYPPPAPEQHYQPPPPHPHAQYHMPPNMSMQGPPQDPYRLPPPPASYRPDVYPPQGPAAPPPGVYPQAAPRQRTAIACGYCRRRKIRCSGFENSHDGRCSNCIRFNQQCLFTPVSSQAQAFVPAHAAYPHLRNPQNRQRPGVTLYGAQGQPLPVQQQPHSEPTLPPPHGMYTAPVAPLQDPRISSRRGSGAAYEYPEPANLAPVTPISAANYQTQTAAGPYYQRPHDVLTAQPLAYASEGRHSSSPHNSPYTPTHAHGSGTSPQPSIANTTSSSRVGLNVRDMLNPGDHRKEGFADQPRPPSTDQNESRAADPNQGRSSTDSDMLNALNRRGLSK